MAKHSLSALKTGFRLSMCSADIGHKVADLNYIQTSSFTICKKKKKNTKRNEITDDLICG